MTASVATSAASTTTFTVPRPPAAVKATPGNGAAIVKWTAPIHTGGSPITGYVVTSSPASKPCRTTGATTSAVRGLTNGATYLISVQARNVKV